MPTGRIKYYNFDKGFGFIAQDNSKADVFLHSSAIKQLEYEELRVGQRVKYNVIEGEKGLIAQNVEILLTPTERRWLRQGKSIIPRGYAGFPGQSHGQFADESATPTAHQQPRESETFRERQGRNTPLASSKRASEAPSQSASTRGLGTTEAATPELQKQLSHRLSFGDLYILKQINLETPMFFALYHSTHLPAIVLEMTLSTFTVNSNGSKQQIPKADIKYFYKEMDAENLHAAVETDAGIKAQQLCQLPPDAHAEEIDTADVRQAHKNSVPVAITLREGEIFRGTIDWVSPYEIKLILENGSKVVIFRHAVYELLVDEEPL